MPSTLSTSVRVDFPGRAVAALTSLCAALVAALVLAPARLADRGDSGLSDRRVLVENLQDAVVAYWRSGASEYPPKLARVVDHWVRYSVAEAVITSALLVALIALGRLLWREYVRGNTSGPAKRRAIASAGAIIWGCALFAVWTLTASIQGAAAPFGALLPLLSEGTPGGALLDTLAQVRQHLAHTTSVAASAPPALATMIDDYARFHVVRAMAAAPTALFFLVAAVFLWKRTPRAASDRRGTRTVRSVAGLCVLLFLSFGVVCAANVATAANPEPGLLGFFEGGW
ncbi:MAG: hypothetical protein WA880_11720 [Ornithinimicrobium sp.]